jgi:hypothetical protein
MHRFYSVLLFCFIPVLFAQDQDSFKNSLGWESGLSYRRYVTRNSWIGVNLTGSYNNMLTKGTQFDSNVTVANDSISKHTTDYTDTNVSYSGTIKIEFGKEIFRYKKLNIDAFVAGGYTLSGNKYYRGGIDTYSLDTYSNEEPSQSVLAIIGLEPKLFIWDRISFGTQFGFIYTYTYLKRNSNYSNNYSTSINTSRDNGSSFTNNLKLFGNVSLSSSLIMHFYF